MPKNASQIFTPDLLAALRGLIGVHQSIYPDTPPQGIYFEALVEEAFRRTKKPFDIIEPGGRNQPRHDLLVEDTRISLKTETGENTRADSIIITKLCTTEREPWEASVLVTRVVEHLSRYDLILMFRVIWETDTFRYQLVEIPIEKLRLISTVSPEPIGRRAGRKSLGADIKLGDAKVFRVHFDASDGKCSIRGLGIEHCQVLETWDVRR